MDTDVEILIAEDDDGHAELIVEELRESGIVNPIRRFEHGRALLDFLADPAATREGAPPLLILLDIRMPIMDGVEALGIIKSDHRLRTIPVIMLTTTDDPREIEECYALGCNFYITKPLDFAKFSETLKHVGFFMKLVKIAHPGAA